MLVTGFLPCRAGSKRVPQKSTRRFGFYEGGLLEKKLHQLKSVKLFDEIIVSTNDCLVSEIATQIMRGDSRFKLDDRPDEYCSDTATTDQLIEYLGSTFSFEHMLWTHVTCPFITTEDYELIISKYFEVRKQQYDSLMTVRELKTFLWNNDGPINYDRRKLAWPMTQNLPVHYEIDSGVFLADYEAYTKMSDRIGENVYLYPNSNLGSFDIDWLDDFELAEKLERIIS